MQVHSGIIEPGEGEFSRAAQQGQRPQGSAGGATYVAQRPLLLNAISTSVEAEMNEISHQSEETVELPEGDSGVQQPTPTTVAAIRVTAHKYGLTPGSVYEVAGETESGLYYALRGTSSSVHKEHEGRHWEWHQQGPIPSVIQFRKERSASNGSTMQSSKLQGQNRAVHEAR